MPISFRCPQCHKAYELPEAKGGKRARCKQCGQEYRVPVAGGARRPPRPTHESAKSYALADVPAPSAATPEPERPDRGRPEWPAPRARTRRDVDPLFFAFGVVTIGIGVCLLISAAFIEIPAQYTPRDPVLKRRTNLIAGGTVALGLAAISLTTSLVVGGIDWADMIALAVSVLGLITAVAMIVETDRTIERRQSAQPPPASAPPLAF